MLLFSSRVVYVLWQAHRAIERGAHEARVLTLAAAQRRPARVRAADADARALHVPRARVLRAARRSSRPLRLVYVGPVGALPPRPLVPVRVLQLAVATSRHLQLQPWFDWLFGGFDTDTWQKKLWSLAVTADRLGRRVARRRLGCAGRARAAPRRRVAADADRGARQPGRSPHEPADRWRPRRGRRAAAGGRARALGAARARRRSRALFGLVVLRGETTPGDEPQRQRLPPADGALGRAGRSARAACRSTAGSRTCRSARRSSTTTRASRTRSPRTPRASTGAGDQTHVPLDPVPAARAVADLRLPRRAPARLGAAGPPRQPRPSRRSSSARPATATSTAATRGRATASTRSSGRCGCCRSPGD